MRKLIQQPEILFLLLVLSIQSCKNYEDFPGVDDVDYQPELAAPIFHGTVSVEDLIEDVAEDLDEISIQPDGSILFSYEADFIEQGVSEFLEPIPDFPVATNQPSVTVPFDVMEGYQVRTMTLNSGTLSFTATNSQTPEDVNLTIRFPELIRNGQVFSATTFLNYTGSMPVESNIAPINLSGYTLALENDSLTIEYVATDMQGNPVDITLITGEAIGWVASQVTGVWEQEVVEVDQDTIEIDLFNEDYIDGDITFTDPRISFEVDNSFGVPVRIVVRTMNVITTDNQVLSVEGEAINNGFDINYPELSEIGSSKQTVFTFDKDNSNIGELLNSRPSKLFFIIDAIVNPENSTSVGFLNENSTIDISVKTELSAEGMVNKFQIEEQFEVEVEEDDADEIDFVELKLISRNGIPLDVTSQFYFLNEEEQVIDSLFAEGAKTILAAAQANGSGNAADSPEQITRVMLTRNQIDYLVNYSEMMSRSSLSTTNNGSVPVSINVNQELEMNMGMRLKLR